MGWWRIDNDSGPNNPQQQTGHANEDSSSFNTCPA
jgi:hypothetical protein